MPPLLTGEIEETTGLCDALNCVMDIEISCGVLRIASKNFIGLIGIASANLIIGAVTKDENASKLTDGEAVDKILSMTEGTFEYYEVPQKELSRLDQSLALSIPELLATKYGADRVDVRAEGSESPDGSESADGRLQVDTDSIPEDLSAEIVEEQPSQVDAQAEELPEENADGDIKTEDPNSQEHKPEAAVGHVDPPQLNNVVEESGASEVLPDVSALDAIQAPSFKSSLDAIPAPSVKSPVPLTGSLLSKFNEKKSTLEHGTVARAADDSEQTELAEAPTSQTAAFDPATDELQLNAAATVERIKKFRKPDAEIAAEAEKAQRAKFASSRKHKDSVEDEVSEAERQRIRPLGQQSHLGTAPKLPSKVQASPKVLVGVGVVSAIGILFLLSRGAIANYFVSSAQSQFDKHDYSAALATLSPVFFLDPGNGKTHFLQGEIAKAKGDKKKAFAEFQEALQAQPNDPDTLRAYIFAARKLGKYDLVKTGTESLMQYDTAAAVDGYWFGILGQAKFNLGDFASACADYTQSLKLGLKTPWIYSGRAWAELYNGNPKLAVKDFNIALSFTKDDVWADAQIGKGQALRQLNDLKGALSCYNSALQRNDKLAYGYLRRADLYVATNESEKAFGDFDQALRLDPKLAAARVGKADLYMKRSKLDLALKELNGVPGLDFERAALQIKANMIAQAVASLKKGLATNSKDANKYMDLAYCYSRLNKPEDALDACAKAMVLAPTNSMFVAMHGFYSRQNGQLVSARADFDKALSLDPKNAEAHLWRGMLFADSSDMVSARQDFQEAARLKPSLSAAIDALRRSDRKYLAASASRRSGQPKALPLIDGEFKTLLAQGYAKLKSRQLAQAVQYLASAVRQNPNSVEARRYLAYALVMQGDLFDAIVQYRELVNMGSSSLSDLRTLGDLLLKVDQAQEAVDIFKRILVSDPIDTDARCRLANAYSALGDLKSGIEVCDVGKKVDPSRASTYDALAEKLKKNEGLHSNTKAPTTGAPSG